MAFKKMGASKKEIISLCNSMTNLDFLENLKDIHCRTLILCGERDRANYSASIKLQELIPNSVLADFSAYPPPVSDAGVSIHFHALAVCTATYLRFVTSCL